MSKAERNAAILAAYEAGESMGRIGRRHGIGAERVRQIVLRAGATPRGGREPYSAALLEQATALLKQGQPIAHIAAALGVSEHLHTRLVRAGLHTPSRETTPWSEAERDVLRALYGRQSAARIAAALKRTRNEVIGQAYRLGLSAKGGRP